MAAGPFCSDQLGSTRALSDIKGNLVASLSYEPYGSASFFNLFQLNTPFGFAGQYTDLESGLLAMGTRYYDPQTGQFLTSDPLRAVTRQPYAYANGDPVNFTDPSGLQAGGSCSISLPGPGPDLSPQDAEALLGTATTLLQNLEMQDAQEKAQLSADLMSMSNDARTALTIAEAQDAPLKADLAAAAGTAQAVLLNAEAQDKAQLTTDLVGMLNTAQTALAIAEGDQAQVTPTWRQWPVMHKRFC
jgi:RHS repeat-associated protein